MKKKVSQGQFFFPVCSILIIIFGSYLICPPLTANVLDEDVQETVKLWFLHNIKKELGLPPEQSLALLEKIEKIETIKRNFAQFERTMLKKIEALLKNEIKTPETYAQLVQQIDEKHEQMLILQKETNNEIKKMLSPIQRAQLMILRKKLERTLRNIVDRLRDKERRKARRRFRDERMPPANHESQTYEQDPF